MKFVCSAALLASYLILAPSSAMLWAMPQGNNGENGVAGDPGTDGEDGSDGEDVFRTEDDSVFRSIFAFAGNGGRGGNGGDGIDGDDADSLAAGGNGGNGGRGGFAEIHNVGFLDDMFARGGRGGNGGHGGLGTPGLDGLGGNGGHGGHADVTFIGGPRSRFSTARISAAGGFGGHATGAGAVAGNGGSGSLRLSFESQYRTNAYARLFGGNGGDAFNGAVAGQGGSVFFGYQQEFSVEQSSADGQSLQMIAWAGDGGDAYSGTAGRSGTARVDLSRIVDEFRGPNITFSQLHLTVQGGAGGRGFASGRESVAGQRGAVGVISNHSGLFFDDAARLSHFTGTIQGGRGGSALGRFNQADGGHGATALFTDTLRVDNRFDLFGNRSERAFNGTISGRGGDGGHAQGSGRSGNGASVMFENPFFIESNGSANFRVSAFGGDGGWGQLNGNGGHAEIRASELLQMADPASPNLGPHGSVYYQLTAVGGDAGRGVAPINGAFGGNASIRTSQQSNRSVTMDLLAVGGLGNHGKAGDAFILATGHAMAPTMESDNDRRSATVRATAQAAKLAGVSMRPAIGGDASAWAESRAETRENRGTSFASARAQAGYGFIRSGGAYARATAYNDQGTANASAGSLALGDRDRESDNFSVAEAFSESQTEAIAFAHAASSGLTSRSFARTESTSTNIEATSLATSQTFNWQHNAAVQAKARFVSNQGTLGTLRTSSLFTFGGDSMTGLQRDVSADLLLLPDPSFADGFIPGDGMLNEIFVGGETADILGVGRVNTRVEDMQLDGPVRASAEFDFDLQVRDFHNDENLIFGLFETDSSGEGFSEASLMLAYNDRTFFEGSFDDLASASAFFDDRWFDLREMPNDRSFVSFNVKWTSTLDSPDDAFNFGFVFGNAQVPMAELARFSAVPEPGAVVALWFAATATALRRRRKRQG